MAEVTSVRVAARLRPLTAPELKDGCVPAIYAIPETSSVVMGSGSAEKSFGFDYVFPSESDTRCLYETCVLPLLQRALEGYNATIFAYGQTGSGKTFTMMEGYETIEDPATAEILGVTPRLIKDLFTSLQNDQATISFQVKTACLEIYNEQVFDLLSDSGAKAAKNIIIRDNEAGDQIISGLTEIIVNTPAEVAVTLARGMQARATASTNMNARSSRSHAIFTLIVEQTVTNGAEEGDAMLRRTSRIHLVDLAGSERAKKTGAEGARLREAASINKGLLALGNVINALAGIEDDSKEGGGAAGVHVPFRDSKLTRLLKSSLGGNAHTLMIACCSPADANVDETLSTLRYAARARCIKNKASVNTDPMTAQITDLRRQIKELQEALLTARATTPISTSYGPLQGQTYAPAVAAFNDSSAADCDEEKYALLERLHTSERQHAALAAQMSKLREELDAANEDYTDIADQLAAAENKRDKFMWYSKEVLAALQKLLVTSVLASDPTLQNDVQVLESKGRQVCSGSAADVDVAIDFGYVDSFLDTIANIESSPCVTSTLVENTASPEKQVALLTTEDTPAATAPSSPQDLAKLRSQFNEVTRMITQKTRMLEASSAQNKTLTVVADGQAKDLGLKIKSMEHELKERTRERDALLRALDAQKQKSFAAPSTASADVATLAAKLKDADEQITTLQTRMKDATKKAAWLQKTELRSEGLLTEIQQLHRSRALMQRQMREASERSKHERLEAQRQAAKAEIKAEKAELQRQRATKQLEEEQAKSKKMHEEMLRLKKQREEKTGKKSLQHNADMLIDAGQLSSITSEDIENVNVTVHVAQAVAGSLSGTRDTTFTASVTKWLSASDELEDSDSLAALATCMMQAKGHKELSPELRRKLEGLIGGTVSLKRAQASLELLKEQRRSVMAKLDAAVTDSGKAELERKRFILSNQISNVNDTIISLNTQLDVVKGAYTSKRSNKSLASALVDMPTCLRAVTWLLNLSTEVAMRCDTFSTDKRLLCRREQALQMRFNTALLQERTKTVEMEQKAAEVLQDSEEGIYMILQDAVQKITTSGDSSDLLKILHSKLDDAAQNVDVYNQTKSNALQLEARLLEEQKARAETVEELQRLKDEYEALQITMIKSAAKEKAVPMKSAPEEALMPPTANVDLDLAIPVDIQMTYESSDEDAFDGLSSEGGDDSDEEEYEEPKKAGKTRRGGGGNGKAGPRRRDSKASSFSEGGDGDEHRPAKKKRAAPSDNAADGAADAQSKPLKEFCGCTKDCSSARCPCRAAGRACTQKCKKCKDCTNGKNGIQHNHSAEGIASPVLVESEPQSRDHSDVSSHLPGKHEAAEVPRATDQDVSPAQDNATVIARSSSAISSAVSGHKRPRPEPEIPGKSAIVRPATSQQGIREQFPVRVLSAVPTKSAIPSRPGAAPFGRPASTLAVPAQTSVRKPLGVSGLGSTQPKALPTVHGSTKPSVPANRPATALSAIPISRPVSSGAAPSRPIPDPAGNPNANNSIFSSTNSGKGGLVASLSTRPATTSTHRLIPGGMSKTLSFMR